MGMIRRAFNRDKSLTRLIVIFLFIFALCSITKGSNFLKIETFRTMGQLLPEYGFLTLGMALALLAGGIDLSVVYQANLAAIVAAKVLIAFLTEYTPLSEALPVILFSFLAAIAVGLLCGAVNGLLIAGIGIPPILATLGTQSLIYGVAVVVTGGSTLSGIPLQMTNMMSRQLAGIQTTTWLFIVVAILIGLMVSKTTFGYRLRMLGTNPVATTFSGISNFRTLIANYLIIGALAALSGIVMLANMNSAKADNGASYTMQAILIAVLGGVSPLGGRGKVQGVIIAILIVQMISTWISMFSEVSLHYRKIIWGALLLLALIYDFVNNKIENKRAMKT